LEVEGECGEKCWKNVDAVAGSSALHSGDSSVIASMLLSIQPCSSEVCGSGVSGASVRDKSRSRCHRRHGAQEGGRRRVERRCEAKASMSERGAESLHRGSSLSLCIEQG
jgi:hypothetical protein